jgi:tetratricopeptide (TPR) repeat protein
MSRNPSALEAWLRGEYQIWSGISLPSARTDLDDVCEAHLRQWSARRAEGLLLDRGGDEPWSRLKISLFRGRFREAKERIRELGREALGALERAELFQEKARLALLEGEWARSLELVEKALATGPAPFNRVGLHQMRALALFELGRLEEARADLSLVAELGAGLPECVTHVYAQALEARIRARLETPEAGLEQLDRIWRGLGGRLNTEHVSCILRARADLCRLAQRPHFRLALASHLLSESMGERLYSALALLDCQAAAGPCGRARLRPLLEREAAELARIARAREELAGEAAGSTTARSLRGCTAVEDGWRWLEAATSVSVLVFPRLRTRVDLRTGAVGAVALTGRMERALGALRAEPIAKRELFGSVWGGVRYSGRLHDGLIWNLLTRLRRAGLPVVLGEEGVHAPSVLVVTS